MFLKTPWLVPLIILLLAGVVFFASSRPALLQNSPSDSNPSPPIINTKAKGFLAIKGAFVIIGKSPDGDSVRFKPDDQQLLFRLKNSGRIKVSKDGSVQLRFEGIDAPELHYGDLEQPLGAKSRDVLLDLIGFKNVQLDNRMVRGSNPPEIRGVILSQAAEGNGRPISYCIVGKFAEFFEDGSRVALTDEILRQTLNIAMLQNGMAYYTVYSSTPPEQRSYLREVSSSAKAKKLGVWAIDKTSNFTLKNQSDIDVDGQLILPKLFRRASSYLRQKDFKGNLKQWLVWTQTQKQPENDLVQIGATGQRLSDWLEVRGSSVMFKADVLDAVFVDK